MRELAFSLVRLHIAWSWTRRVIHGMKQVVVQRGQTLWSIASAAQPMADPQAVIQRIIDANSLPSVTIEPGEVLWVPRG